MISASFELKDYDLKLGEEKKNKVATTTTKIQMNQK